MNFIIPKNYKFKPKLFGIIDYQTAVLDCIWAIVLYVLSNIFFSATFIKIYFCIGLFVPFLLFSIVGINNEGIFSVLVYIFKFYANQKIYLYKK